MNFMTRRRWSDNDFYFGPFTFARDKNYRSFAIVLGSGEDEYPGCSLRFSAFVGTMIVALPSWALRPERHKVFPQWDAATIQRLGRDWYWNVIKREYGFSIQDGYLSVSFGRVTHDSSTEQRWGYFLPWTQWRHMRHSLYDIDGNLFAHLPQIARWNTPEYEASRKLEESCPTITFAFTDFDGEQLTAKTKIEEREWLFGTGWFKWLSWFRKPKVSRSLDIKFSGETGRRKGSWKGGTIGHSIKMRPDEGPLVAFMRYCDEHEMRFLGVAPTCQTCPEKGES